jgi:hypothetical protein
VVECTTIFLPIDAQDFQEIGEFEGFSQFPAGISTGERRVNCFNVLIADDDVDEDVESFTVILELDVGQGGAIDSGVNVDPNVTTIFIIDNDGNGWSSDAHSTLFSRNSNYFIHASEVFYFNNHYLQCVL